MVDVHQPAVVELPRQVGTADPKLAGQLDVAGRDRPRLLPPLPGVEGGDDRRILGPGLEDPPSDGKCVCRRTTMRPKRSAAAQPGGSDTSAGSTGPLVTVMVADNTKITAAVYEAAAAHSVQVRSLTAA
jgi:hypothetical protein